MNEIVWNIHHHDHVNITVTRLRSVAAPLAICKLYKAYHPMCYVLCCCCRERMDASDFTAALDDYRQYLRRKQEAEQMRQQFSRQHLSTDGQDGETAADGDAAAASDFSLKPGQTIRISLSPVRVQLFEHGRGVGYMVLRSSCTAAAAAWLFLLYCFLLVTRCLCSPAGHSSTSNSKHRTVLQVAISSLS